MYYMPGCNDTAYVQVQEDNDQVLLRVVREGPRSRNLCGTQVFQRVPLSSPLGNRRVVHDSVYDSSSKP